MTTLRGATAAITGAGGGIGAALALKLAARGADVALADRNEAGLRAVAAAIGNERKVTTHLVDVGDPAQIATFAKEAIAAHPRLNIVVNNAGVTLLGQFDEVDQAQMEWLMNINFWAVVHSTRAFLPHLSAQREAHIVAPPGQSAYAASKFAVRGFSESLRHELQMAKSPVRVSVVHPGGVATNIVRNSLTGSGIADSARRVNEIARFDQLPKKTIGSAARRIIEGIENNKPRMIVGNDARLVDLLQRLRPSSYWPVVELLERVAKKR
jgi:short-subunit dehydrogenase